MPYEMALTIGLITVILAAIGGGVFFLARRNAHRWGVVPGAPVALPGGGAYRGAEVTPMVPRGTPAIASWAAGLSFVWALATFGFFAPLGLLLAVLLSRESPIGCLSVGLVSVDGLALAVGLCVVGIGILRARPSTVVHARPVAIWSFVHHGLVMLVFGLWACHPDHGEIGLMLAAASAIPCAIGAGVAGLLLRASDRADCILVGDRGLVAKAAAY